MSLDTTLAVSPGEVKLWPVMVNYIFSRSYPLLEYILNYLIIELKGAELTHSFYLHSMSLVCDTD